MALMGTFNLFGVSVPTAYALVLSVNGGKQQGAWFGRVGIYAERPPAPDPANPQAAPQPAQIVDISAPYVANQDALKTIYDAAAAMPSFSQMTSDEPKNILTLLEFMDRFSDGENDRIHASTDANVVRALRKFDVATFIDLSRQDTQNYVNYLQSIPGMLDAPTDSVTYATRAAEILRQV